MNRRTFSKMLVSLLPAAWVASKVKGEVVAPKPPQPKPDPLALQESEHRYFDSFVPMPIELTVKKPFRVTKLYIEGGTIDWVPRPDFPNPA